MSRLTPEELLAIYRNGLLEDTMPFWLDHCVDHQHGGFTMALDRTGQVVDTDKGVWQQGRFTWLLGELYNNLEARDEWLTLARHGAEFLLQHCFDASDGRMWFHVTQDGKPIRKRRYAFSESFAAIAFAELAKATGETAYAEHAVKTFHRFVQHNLDPVDTPKKFTDHRQTRSLGFPMIAIATAQELRESIDFADANQWIDRSIETIQRFHLKPELNCVMETVGRQGEVIDHFDGRTLNPGHAIEGAWFLMWEGAHRNDPTLTEMGCQMLDWMWQRGWDPEYGGILYFTDVHGHAVQEYWHDMKFWWPQCEAIIATLLAFRLTGRQKYADWHQQIHQWAYQHFPDSEHGEWFGYLDRTGRVTSTLKGNLWKGPFHLPRMQHICTTILSL